MDPMTDELYEEQKKKGGTVTSAGTPGTVPQQPEVPVMQVNDYSSWLKEMNAAKQQAALAELDAAYQKNVASVDRAEKGLARDYQTARNQTVGASEQAKRNFAQYAAASGLNSGTGGQAELARSVTLQNNLNAINQQEADTLADSALKRAQLEIDYNNAIAQAQAEGDYELANALYQEKVRVDSALNDAANKTYQLDYQAYRDYVGDDQWQKTMDQNQAQFDTNQRYQEERDAANRADAQKEALADYGWAFLKMGTIPSAEMLAAMGITEADALAYANAVKAATEAAYGTGAGGTSAMNLTTAKQAAAAGYFDDQVLSVLRENGYSDAMLNAIYGYQPPLVAPPVVDTPSDAAHALADDFVTFRAGRDALGTAPSGTTSATIDGKTVAEYDAAAGNYASVKALADGMKANGSSTSEITAMLKEAWETGVLNTNDYMSLVNKYRG